MNNAHSAIILLDKEGTSNSEQVHMDPEGST